MFFLTPTNAHRWVRRTPGDTHDFTTGNFTTDATWRDLDLSTIVPNRAVKVAFRIAIQTGVAGDVIVFRKKGETTNYCGLAFTTQEALKTFYAYFELDCNTDRYIQYYATNKSWTEIFLDIHGWHLPSI